MTESDEIHDARVLNLIRETNTARLNRALKDARCPVHDRPARVVAMDKAGWRLENTCCNELLKLASHVLAKASSRPLGESA